MSKEGDIISAFVAGKKKAVTKNWAVTKGTLADKHGKVIAYVRDSKTVVIIPSSSVFVLRLTRACKDAGFEVIEDFNLKQYLSR